MLADEASFLPERTARPLTLPRQAGLEPKALYLGQGQNAFEVALVEATTTPTAGALQAAWKARRGGRASPVLLVALSGVEAALCGPAGDQPPVRFDVDRGQAELPLKVIRECLRPSANLIGTPRSPFSIRPCRRSKPPCQGCATRACLRCTH